MRLKRSIIIEMISALLILLFVYTAVSKLSNFNVFKAQIHSQVFSQQVSTLLVWTLPGTELITAMLLLMERTRFTGFKISAVLLSAFTAYIGLVLLDVFDHVPCSCGGVMNNMNWNTHFIFNVCFLLLTALAIIINHKERRCSAINI